MRDSNRDDGRKTRAQDKIGRGTAEEFRCRTSADAHSWPARRQRLLARSGPASAADYPDRPITLIIPVPARRQHHHRHPLGQRQARRSARPADRDRQPRRRRRHRRHPRAREIRSRRLHHRARLYRHPGDRAEPLLQRRLRPAQGLLLDRADRHGAEHAGGASVVPGQDGAGIHRLRQGEPGQGQLRLGRHRHGQPRLRRVFRQPRPASSSSTFPTRAPARR